MSQKIYFYGLFLIFRGPCLNWLITNRFLKKRIAVNLAHSLYFLVRNRQKMPRKNRLKICFFCHFPLSLFCKEHTCKMWHMILDIWYVTQDMWQVTCDTWHRTCETWFLLVIFLFLLYLCYYLQTVSHRGKINNRIPYLPDWLPTEKAPTWLVTNKAPQRWDRWDCGPSQFKYLAHTF